MQTDPLKVAVVTGGHAYDVIKFHKLWQSLAGIEAYIQHIDDFAAASPAVRAGYEVVVFYIMMMAGPTDEGLPGYRGRPKAALEELGRAEQGIVVLHHALLAYPDWPVWDEVVGLAGRQLAGYEHDETMAIKVSDRAHPITQGISDWTMVDETYDMADAGSDNQILLTVNQANSMNTLAWAHQYQASRVFCFQSGHDHQAWEDETFREILKRGIAWSGRRL